jgi:hypothetical protein
MTGFCKGVIGPGRSGTGSEKAESSNDGAACSGGEQPEIAASVETAVTRMKAIWLVQNLLIEPVRARKSTVNI